MHFSKFVFGLGNGMNLAPFSLSGYLLSNLQVPYEQCLTLLITTKPKYRKLFAIYLSMHAVVYYRWVGGAYFWIHVIGQNIRSQPYMELCIALFARFTF